MIHGVTFFLRQGSLLCLFLFLFTTAASAQGRVRVFLDCGACDFNYLRQQIQFID